MYKRQEESVVVFCHHKAIHSLLHNNLAQYTPASIIGGQTDVVRQREIDRFQKGQTKLMIAGLRAGNVGINLTNAKYVIFINQYKPQHPQITEKMILCNKYIA